MIRFFCIICLLISVEASAKIEALFHPRDPTLEKISEWILEAQKSVDIAMYNMETGPSSPVIQALKSEHIQARLKDRSLVIRLIFEGSDPVKSQRKMEELEKLGVDARYLGKSIKMHHKFAVIDSELPVDRVITGSANWSMASYTKYNENILFIEDEAEASAQFQEEFNFLWKLSKEFGFAGPQQGPASLGFSDQPGLEVFYNSQRILVKEKSLSSEVWLAQKVIEQIETAQKEIQIASTRIRLEPIMAALLKAAERGVHVRIVISQDDYRDLWKRAHYLLKHPNIQLRVKFYSLKVSDYLEHQMHHKFMVVDQRFLLTGSFNWSKSSEENHIENLIFIDQGAHSQVVHQFVDEFEFVWGLGRHQFEDILANFEIQEEFSCRFSPMVLTVPEVKKLLMYRQKCLMPQK